MLIIIPKTFDGAFLKTSQLFWNSQKTPLCALTERDAVQLYPIILERSQCSGPSLVWITAYYLVSANTLPEFKLACDQLDHRKPTPGDIEMKNSQSNEKNMHLKFSSAKYMSFYLAPNLLRDHWLQDLVHYFRMWNNETWLFCRMFKSKIKMNAFINTFETTLN